MVHRSLTLLTLLCIIALACGCQQRAVISGDQRPVASQPEDAGPVEETPEAETPEEPEESSTQAVSPRYAKEAERLAARGQEALDNGEWLEANEAFSRAVELDRGNIDAWIGRGRVLTGLAQPEDGLVDLDVIDDAVNSFSNAIEIQSDLADAWFGRAQAESVLGRAYFMEAGCGKAPAQPPAQLGAMPVQPAPRQAPGRKAPAPRLSTTTSAAPFPQTPTCLTPVCEWTGRCCRQPVLSSSACAGTLR